VTADGSEAQGTLDGRTARDRARWERETLGPFLQRVPERRPAFETLSGLPVERVYAPEDLAGWRYEERLGYPGEFPFTRGVYPTMYRGRLWTMRMFAGFGRPEDTNRRFKFLLEQGQTGLSTAFDMPSLMGYDADHPRARGEVGREGVSVSTLADMERLFDGIPLGRVSTSMTINCTASIILAMYLAVAERQGVPWTEVDGTIQNDMLKEFSAQKEWICPPEPAVRIVVDMIEFCMRAVPKFHPVSISGYHIREAGATAVQELAFTLADGIAYVEACVRRGLDVDRFAPRLSFFFDIHSDFFEEIAKLRAARRMWATIMKERFGATDPRAMLLRTHTQTAGVSLTAQQPLNNIARVAIQALAAILGGAQSLHTNSYDETWALPTEEAVTVALRTQQILAEETGVTHTVDPLGGSYFVEALTDRMEAEAWRLIRKIDELGGMIRALDAGFPQQEIADSGYRTQLQEDAGERVVVGVNRYVQPEEKPISYLRLDDALEREQVERVQAVKAGRDQAEVARQLRRVADACRSGDNLMPVLVEAVKAYVSLGEISSVYREVLGRYREPIVF
jgi:methylmalonyl-CoA mutase N-terminal domain/subunit